MPPDDPDAGREDSIPTPPDPRRETRRSPLETTKKHPAFDDPRSPDASPQSLLIGELHAVLDAFREEQRREAASLRSYIRSTTDETLASHELSRRHIVHLAGLTGEVWRRRARRRAATRRSARRLRRSTPPRVLRPRTL